MQVDVLGYQHLDFPDEKGNRINGYQIYFGEPIESDGEGMAYVKKFVSFDRVIGKVGLGLAEFDIQLSLKGKPFINSFRMVPDAKSVSSK